MFCSNCGKKASGNFCSSCGAALRADAPEAKRVRTFFISHDSDEKALALQLYDKLKKFESVKCWLDVYELDPGHALDAIGEAIEKVDVVVVLWSSESRQSQWVKTSPKSGSPGCA